MEIDTSSPTGNYVLADEARADVLSYVKRYEPVYLDHLKQIPIETLVKFIDKAEWSDVWKRLQGSGDAAFAEAVTSSKSLTPPAETKKPASGGKSPFAKGNLVAQLKQMKQEIVVKPPLDRTIYVCTQNHTKGTLVHEMLHWLTHEDFNVRFTLNVRLKCYMNVKDSLIEGTTEHITRKILKEKKVRTDVNGKGDFYGPEYALMRKLSKELKLASAQAQGNAQSTDKVEALMENVLAKAYFRGNPLALAKVEEMFMAIAPKL